MAIEVTERRAFGLDDLTRYPLLATDFIDFLRKIMPPQRHKEIVFSIVVTARKPASRHSTEDHASSSRVVVQE